MTNKQIKIQGGCFKDEHTCEFQANTNIALIYGQNGSGKSSIANALLEYKNNQYSMFSKVELVGLDNINSNKIYVFNEKFINDNVRFAEDGKLNSIVLLGEMLKLDDQINELKETKNNEEKALEKYKNTEKELTDNKKSTSYEYYKK